MQQEEDECQATLRLCQIERPSTGSCGFHLSRTAWDPYPWVSGVECGSAADFAGLQPGDCVLEVNGEDVLGQRIGQVASKVRARDDSVTLLLWNAGSDPHTAATNISGNGPTPVSLQRLSNCLQSVLQLLECPVCLETIPPPAFQCCHGHVLCGRCRARADKCPVCRVSLGPKGRCLLADKLHNLLTSVLNQDHKKKHLYSKNRRSSTQIQQPFHLKSRIATEILSTTNKDTLLQTKSEKAGSSSETQNRNTNLNSILMQQPKASSEENISFGSSLTRDMKQKQIYSKNVTISAPQIQQYFPLKSRIVTENTDTWRQTKAERVGNSADPQDENMDYNSILVQPKASSEENVSFESARPDMNQLPSGEQALRIRSVSAEQIPNTQCIKKQIHSNQVEEFSFHCPYQLKSTGHCRNVLIGSQALLKHLRDDHIGPLIQYFLKVSRAVVKLRLPLSSSRSPPSSLTSFTTDDDAVFFVQVAAGATPGQRLVWLWLIGDGTLSDRYRLRLTLPEGDTHTGPVFPLTSSWNEVVNSNCCLSIEESRYNRANPEVRLEILDVANN